MPENCDLTACQVEVTLCGSSQFPKCVALIRQDGELAHQHEHAARGGPLHRLGSSACIRKADSPAHRCESRPLATAQSHARPGHGAGDCPRDRTDSPSPNDGGPARVGGSSHGALWFPSRARGNEISTWHGGCQPEYRHPAVTVQEMAPPPSQLRAAAGAPRVRQLPHRG
eukprot:13626527-Alexandrium_andersonii.AAC.2